MSVYWAHASGLLFVAHTSLQLWSPSLCDGRVRCFPVVLFPSVRSVQHRLWPSDCLQFRWVSWWGTHLWKAPVASQTMLHKYHVASLQLRQHVVLAMVKISVHACLYSILHSAVCSCSPSWSFLQFPTPGQPGTLAQFDRAHNGDCNPTLHCVTCYLRGLVHGCFPSLLGDGHGHVELNDPLLIQPAHFLLDGMMLSCTGLRPFALPRVSTFCCGMQVCCSIPQL